jgi:exonuclease III
MSNLQIISLNVKGIRARDKRLKLFKWFTEKHKADIVFLQETHSTPSDEKTWADEWNGNIYFGHGETNAKGVCIMMKNHTVHNVFVDNAGGYIMIDISLNDRRLALLNIYAPNQDNPDFIRDIINVIELQPNDDRIIGGDFNCVMNDDLDKKGGATRHSNQKMKTILSSYVNEADLVDIWRKQHINDKVFSYHYKFRNQYIFSRLDFFLLSFGLSNLATVTSICPSILTDHSLIKLTLKIDTEARGPGFWKFNCSLLQDKEYIESVKKWINETVSIEQEQMPGLLWEAIKLKIRTETIRYSAQKKRSKNNIMQALEKRLERLQAKFQSNPTDEDNNDINLIKHDINNLLQEQVMGCLVRSKLTWQEYAEKPSKFFLSLEKRNYNNKTIKSIKHSNGTIITDKENILRELHRFYSKLYTSSHTDTPNYSELDNLNVPKLTLEEKDKCEGTLSQQEILDVLKTCKNNKSPGTDGFPAEFYKTFWLQLKEYLTNALNYNYVTDELSVTQKEGLITLIPKKDKDTLLIKNWRPITLLNQDYKLATKAIAKRICNVLPNIINSDQTGFLKGRYIGENILRLTSLMDYLDETNEPALLLSADFEKAFDCLKWSFIDYCLAHFNFGLSIRKWIKIFYTGITTRVSNNGWVTDIFMPTRGSRQGCPLSPYVFIICAEILACLLRNDVNIKGVQINDKNFLISQYADDTLITLKYSEQNLRNIIKIFEEYTRYSGLKVNYEKSEIMPLGPLNTNITL